MAISKVGSTTPTVSKTSSSPNTPAWAADMPRTAGDLLILRVFANGANAISTPAGWTDTGVREVSGTLKCAIFYKIAAGADAAPSVVCTSASQIQCYLEEFTFGVLLPGSPKGIAGTTTLPTLAANAGPDVSGGLSVSIIGYYNSGSTVNITETQGTGWTKGAWWSGVSNYHAGGDYHLNPGTGSADSEASVTFSGTPTGTVGLIATFVTGIVLKPGTPAVRLRPVAPSLGRSAVTLTPGTPDARIQPVAPAWSAGSRILTPGTPAFRLVAVAASWGVVSGGAFSLKVNGVELSDYVEIPTSLRIQKASWDQPGKLNIVLKGATGAPLNAVAVEQEIVLMESAEVYFAGILKVVKPTTIDEKHTNYIVLTLEAQSYDVLLNDDVIQSGLRTDVEDDDVRINWLLSTFGTHGITGAHVQKLETNLPAQDFSGKTLKEAIKMVGSVAGAFQYVDNAKDLHHFLTEVDPAPFELSASPDNVTSFGFKNFQFPYDSTNLKNDILARPKPGGSASDTWYWDATSIAAYGDKQAVLDCSTIDDQTELDAAGNAFLAASKDPQRSGSLTCFVCGLLPGQTVKLTHPVYSLTSYEQRITSLSIAYPLGSSDKPEYTVEFGHPPKTLGQKIVAMVQGSKVGAGTGVAFPYGGVVPYATEAGHAATATTAATASSVSGGPRCWVIERAESASGITFGGANRGPVIFFRLPQNVEPGGTGGDITILRALLSFGASDASDFDVNDYTMEIDSNDIVAALGLSGYTDFYSLDVTPYIHTPGGPSGAGSDGIHLHQLLMSSATAMEFRVRLEIYY